MEDVPEELLVKYKEDIPKKLEELQRLVEDLTKAREALKGYFHKLKGNAAIYGYEQISTICKEKQEEYDSETDLPQTYEKIKEIFYGK